MEILRVVLPWAQIVLAFAITAAILLQKNETGLGNVFGGGDQVMHTKRGLERGLFLTTVSLAGLFIVLSIITLLIQAI